MKNSQVVAGTPVTFLHSGVRYKGIIKSMGGGPEPSGRAVVVEQIQPPIQGQPNVTLDASDLSQAFAAGEQVSFTQKIDVTGVVQSVDSTGRVIVVTQLSTPINGAKTVTKDSEELVAA